MIWILATRGASTKLRSSPFTETTIEGMYGVVYKVGIEPVPFAGDDTAAGALGTFDRGLSRISGFVFSYHGSVAEALLGVTGPIDLVIRYRANGQLRKRTLSDALFVGDAVVTVPGLNTGVSRLIGVPFRVQIPHGADLSAHVADAVDT